MAADVGGGVNYWNANYSGYGTMSKNFNSMRTILNNNSLYSSYDLLGMYNAIFAFNPGGCFSATSAVLMSDLSWKMITEIEAGDMLYTSHGDSAVSKLNVASLGQRRMYEMYDGSLSFTSNHCLWARKEKDYFWSMELSSYENDYTEEEKELFSILKELDDNFTISDSILKPIFNDKTEVFAGSVDENEKFAYITGWKQNKPVLTGITAPDYQVYCPAVENKGLIIVNGYLVESHIDETIQTYNFNWDDKLSNELSEAINDLPKIVKSYIDYRTENPTEIP